jgi:putative membrane protein
MVSTRRQPAYDAGMAYVFLRIVHLVAIAALAGCLIIENIAVGAQLSAEDRSNLLKVDRVYGLSAAATLLAGLALWFGVGKPAEFYSSNPLFHAKLGLFTLAALISLLPTLFFWRARKSTDELVPVPRPVRWSLRVQLIILPTLPILAWLMARGVGLPAA